MMHWGSAAFLFCLDLSHELALQTVPEAAVLVFRNAARTAILENRVAIEQGQPPLPLRAHMWDTLSAAGSASATASVFEWVEAALPSATRPQNGMILLLAPLDDLAHLRDIDAQMSFAPLEGAGYAAVLFGQIAPEASDKLTEAAFAIDDHIDRENLSEWDRAILERNGEIYAPENPLALMIDGVRLGLMRDAAQRVMAGLDGDQAALLTTLCQPRDTRQ